MSGDKRKEIEETLLRYIEGANKEKVDSLMTEFEDEVKRTVAVDIIKMIDQMSMVVLDDGSQGYVSSAEIDEMVNRVMDKYHL